MRSFALAIASLVLLSSCTDDPEPIEPTPSGSPNTAPSPPGLPPSARDKDPAGAANFVRHWLETSNYAAVTGDTSELKDLSATSCTGCGKYIDLYESIYAKGGYIRGATREIGEVELEINEREVLVRGEVRAEEGRYRDSKDGPERVSKANETTIEFAVAFEEHRWVMQQIGLPG